MTCERRRRKFYTFDFDNPKSIDRDLVVRASKTHLANAIGQLACLRGYRVRFTTAADLVNDLVAAQARKGLHRRLALWAV